VNELLCFIFIPLIVLGLLHLRDAAKKFPKTAPMEVKTKFVREQRINLRGFYLCFIVGYAGLFYSHLVMAFCFTFILAVALLVNYKTVFKKEFIKPFLLSLIPICLLVSPFLLPMFQARGATSYVVFGDNAMANFDELQTYTYKPWDYLIRGVAHTGAPYLITVGIVLGGLLAFMFRKKIVNSDKISQKSTSKNSDAFSLSLEVDSVDTLNFTFKILFTFAIASTIFLFLGPLWKFVPKVFWLVQYPWRFETFLMFSLTVLTGLIISYFMSLRPRKKLLRIFTPARCLIVLCLLCSVFSIWFCSRNGFNYYIGDNYEGWSKDIELGYEQEYLSKKAFANYEYLKSLSSDVISTDGESEVFAIIIKDETPDLQFKYKTNGESVVLELPRLFYLGYKIELTQTDLPNARPQELKYSESDRGLILVEIPDGVQSGEISVTYPGTKLDKATRIICGVAIIVLIIILLRSHSYTKMTRKPLPKFPKK